MMLIFVSMIHQEPDMLDWTGVSYYHDDGLTLLETLCEIYQSANHQPSSHLTPTCKDWLRQETRRMLAVLLL